MLYLLAELADRGEPGSPKYHCLYREHDSSVVVV